MNNDWQGEGLANNALLVIFSYLILLRRGEVGLTHKILILAYAGSSPAAVAIENRQIVIATRQGEQPYPLLLIYDRVYTIYTCVSELEYEQDLKSCAFMDWGCKSPRKYHNIAD